MIEHSTLDGATSTREPLLGGPQAPALVIAWCAAAPERAGEVAIFGHRDGSARVLGRGAADPGDADERLAFVRQRPGIRARTPPIDDPFLSRRQLVLRDEAGDLHVENVGKRPMLVDGVETTEAVVAPGSTIEVKGRLLLLCVRRPLEMGGTRTTGRDAPAFGEADADGVVGESEAAWMLRGQIAFAAGRGAHVLLLGESGTGKELVARAIHRQSSRGPKKLVARNAATLPSGLIDAELFGTAANYPNAGMPERVGLVGEADGSTLFLDEIGELSTELSTHLLRVLDEPGEYQRLGESKRRTADVRFVAATNRGFEELKHDVAARFPIRFTVPGLNDRIEDVPLLARHLLLRTAQRDPEIAKSFFEAHGGARLVPRVSTALVRALLAHKYTTHVRELDALLWIALTTSPGNTVEKTPQLDAELARAAAAPTSRRPSSRRPAAGPTSSRQAGSGEVTEEQIRAALAKHAGMREKAWRELGLPSRYVLKRLMQKYGIKD